MRLVQLEAFHFKIHVRTGSKELGHLAIPAASGVEANNRECGEGTGQGNKKGRAANLFHAWVPAEVELDGKPTLLTKGIERKEFLLQGVLVQIGKDRFHHSPVRR